ncbi:MAG: hypothetical protein JWN52_4912 [Actinomycetia bacterium]|nr:hypothetical protein [Actinomycetes bacterium]
MTNGHDQPSLRRLGTDDLATVGHSTIPHDFFRMVGETPGSCRNFTLR